MPNKKTVSNSSLTTYLACPEKYRRTYEDGATNRGPSNPNMLAGTGFHAAMEYAFTRVIEGDSPTIAAAVAHGMAVVHNEWKERGVLVDSLSAISPASVLDELLLRVKNASRWYLSKRFDTFYPLISEHKVLIDIPDRPGWQLDARIDLIEQDGSVVDFKFSGSPSTPKTDLAERSEQLSVYALARLLETGSVPPSLRLEYCRDGGKRISALTRGPTKRSEKDCERTLTRIQHVIDCIESGVYPIASREGIECTGQRCQFFHQCPFGGG
jgi:RecB family exonuclease